MGERLLCKQEVIGSIPFTSTTGKAQLCRPTGARSCTARHPRARLQVGGCADRARSVRSDLDL